MRHKIPNFFLFPVIIMARLYIDTPEVYNSFKQLASEKMFKWQWRVLEKILNM
ncbi:hypothetical protein [Bacillus sp. AG4(2022)]|uniref:hypothetical protein n=1 Tax=Bacillus sp. AG4(2022) TaxID=2962594 RepID=UPI002880C8C4|nr:hypothetical protein [Bacillus sp. AG4(2022)]MDT0160451.1 hypothetical protein [Bacillus sp. AG4(2022)]